MWAFLYLRVILLIRAQQASRELKPLRLRSSARQVRKAGRQTKGVRLMNLGEGATLLAIARNAEEGADEDLEEVGGVEESES